MFPVNCYVLSDETKEAVIIDAGCFYEEEKQALKRYIDSNSLTVKHLLNTHLHQRYIFLMARVLRAIGNQTYVIVPVLVPAKIHPLDLLRLLARILATGMGCRKYIFDGDIITFGNTQLEAIHVPGHSPGSIVFYCKEAHCIFSGDVLFQGSIGRADLTGGNFDELREHICSRLFVLPPDTVVYPGHGDPTTVGAEKANNPFFR